MLRSLACALCLLAITGGCGGGAAAAVRSTSPSAAYAPSSSESVASAGAATPTSISSDESAPSAAPAAQVAGPPALPERVVIQGSIDLQVEDPERSAAGLRAEVERMGGRVVSERTDGAAESWRAQLRLRLPPDRVDPVVAWLEGQGDVTGKRIEAADVSRTLFDQELALANLTAALDRLRKLLDAGGLSMQDILGVEREMTRLRGEIERIKGEKRFLEDRVAFATLDVQVSRRDGAVMSPRTKLYPGPRLAALTLFAPDGRKQTRLGGGVALHIVVPRLTLEVDVFDDVEATADHEAEGHAVIATYGGSFYSDHLGRGRRRFLNPYIGFRLGYGYLDHHAFAAQAEVGVELFKHEHVLVDAGVRATGLFGEEVDAGLVSGASVVFAF